MVAEVTKHLITDTDGVYVDGTFGRGGHSAALLEQLSAKATLFAIDQDLEAIDYGHNHFSDDRLQLIHDNFSNISAAMSDKDGAIDGIFLDVGVSSPQLDEAHRGFSFQQSGPLDMRMDRSTGLTARQWLLKNDEPTIANALWEFGQERHSRTIAKHIKSALKKDGLHSTTELAKLVSAIVKREKNKHPATRTFQALRLVVNDEIPALEKTLEQCHALLKSKGRLATLTFHSLEHQVIKQFRKIKSGVPDVPRGLPVTHNQSTIKLIAKTTPSAAEISKNPRARSAQLTVIEKI